MKLVISHQSNFQTSSFGTSEVYAAQTKNQSGVQLVSAGDGLLLLGRWFGGELGRKKPLTLFKKVTSFQSGKSSQHEFVQHKRLGFFVEAKWLVNKLIKLNYNH